MKKILLVDYYGTCDRDGNVVGHSPKVLKEYKELIQEDFDVSAAVSPCLLQSSGEGFEKVISLKYNIHTERTRSIWKRIKDKLKLFVNIYEVLKVKGYDIVWFYRTDFFLFLFFSLKITQNSTKLIAQIYQKVPFDGKFKNILDIFFSRGIIKFDGLIYTQKSMKGLHPYSMYMPDYYYNKDKYNRYKNILRKDKVVCLGTMSPYKKLTELVDVFNFNNKNIEIKGYFYDKNIYRDLLSRKKNNIIVQDVILSEREYYSTLAEAKYSILPYDIKKYKERTSGILLESLFLGAIIIAPKQLLLENRINGIGYENMSQLMYFDEFVENENNYLSYENPYSDYERNAVKSKLITFLSQILE